MGVDYSNRPVARRYSDFIDFVLGLRFDQIAFGLLPLRLCIEQVGQRSHRRRVAVAHDAQVFGRLLAGRFQPCGSAENRPARFGLPAVPRCRADGCSFADRVRHSAVHTAPCVPFFGSRPNGKSESSPKAWPTPCRRGISASREPSSRLRHRPYR